MNPNIGGERRISRPDRVEALILVTNKQGWLVDHANANVPYRFAVTIDCREISPLLPLHPSLDGGLIEVIENMRRQFDVAVRRGEPQHAISRWGARGLDG